MRPFFAFVGGTLTFLSGLSFISLVLLDESLLLLCSFWVHENNVLVKHASREFDLTSSD